MEKKQYIVQVHGLLERNAFYNYIINNFKLNTYYPREYMIKSIFPFIVDLSTNEFWVCESITCCACAAQNKQIISDDEFYGLIIRR